MRLNDQPSYLTRPPLHNGHVGSQCLGSMPATPQGKSFTSFEPLLHDLKWGSTYTNFIVHPKDEMSWYTWRELSIVYGSSWEPSELRSAYLCQNSDLFTPSQGLFLWHLLGGLGERPVRAGLLEPWGRWKGVKTRREQAGETHPLSLE